jgi:hypothetical protein
MNYTVRTLKSGTEVMVDEKGRVTFFTCQWLVRRPTFCEEPSSFADTFRDEECGVRLTQAESLCPTHRELCDAPYDDWNDMEYDPRTSLSHIG